LTNRQTDRQTPVETLPRQAVAEVTSCSIEMFLDPRSAHTHPGWLKWWPK